MGGGRTAAPLRAGVFFLGRKGEHLAGVILLAEVYDAANADFEEEGCGVLTVLSWGTLGEKG